MKKGTGELLELLKKSSDLSTYMDTASDNMIERYPLSDCLNAALEKKGLEKKQVIRESGIERKYAYEIFRESKTEKKVSRDKVLAICLAMELGCDEVQELLKKAGYAPLYPKYERESIILFGFANGLRLAEVNELLYDRGDLLIE